MNTLVIGDIHGCHDELLALLDAPGLAQQIARHQIGAAAYPAAVDWMRALPRFIDLPESLLVHAMVEPGVALAEQRTEVLVGTLRGEANVRERHARPWHAPHDGAKPIIVGAALSAERARILDALRTAGATAAAADPRAFAKAYQQSIRLPELAPCLHALRAGKSVDAAHFRRELLTPRAALRLLAAVSEATSELP